MIPEYPEFAWFEGMVNSLTHRNYSIKSDCIRISLYDDRLEIFSPGNLPNILTVDNIQNTRYSRNPRIARVLSEFGWVKELNEGVKRIYSEMQKQYLNSPVYSEPNNSSVLLVLENSVTSKRLRNNSRISSMFDRDTINSLNDYELKIMQFLIVNETITVKKTKELLEKGDTFSRKQLKTLEGKGLINWQGSSAQDPTQFYYIKSDL